MNRHNAQRKISPCGNTYCEPGWHCVRGNCQQNKGKFQGTVSQNMKTKGGKYKRRLIKGIGKAAGKVLTAINDATPSKKKTYKLKF